MGISRGNITTNIIKSGLVFNMDAANRACYPRTGTTAVDTVNSISGTIDNSVDFSSNNLGYWEFDGIDTGIIFEEEGTLDNFSEITFALWINGVSGFYIAGKDNGSTGPFSILCRNSRWEWYVRTTDNWYSVLNNTSYGSGWKNIVGTWSGISNESKLYVNGVQIGSTTSTVGSTLNVTNNNFVLGGYDGSTSFDYDGIIANSQIYNRALSAKEVLHNYNALKGRFI
jgi:hypothetical protein